MEQNTINQRLIFLLEKLKVSARTFSEMIGESPTNTQNYVGTRAAEPRAGYIEKVLRHFKTISPLWLMTGEGDPFIGDAPSAPVTISKKKNKGPVQNNTGDHKTITNNVNLDNCQRDLAAANKEIDFLRQQLETKDQLIAAKDEMLALLRGSNNRPN